MQRCLDLAKLGAGHVAPNPMVGAVLVHLNRIIGEGYHQQFGGAHAEVNCIDSVKDHDRQLIRHSTMYVSLEPCAHFGKTPPCADLVIRHGIPRVVIACRDPFEAVDGKGIEKLKAAGVDVITGILEEEAIEINKRFFTFHLQRRPYIILKWAQTSNGKIAGAGSERLLISNQFSNRLVHRWRSEEAGILIGTNTAIADNPELTNRHWSGPSPVRMVVDVNARLTNDIKLVNDPAALIFTAKDYDKAPRAGIVRLPGNGSLPAQLCEAMHARGILSVLVEGGAMLLQSFIDANLWDEARIITNTTLLVNEGMDAPMLKDGVHIDTQVLQSDSIAFYRNIKYRIR
jgi:diaminohydroxyphosphoribosylaminopyrimidine deaminase / 5-amino-6-(5-phosphoribosylamino)uracil reductase